MATPPTRAEISGTPSRATANAGFGKLWDYVTGLLGSTGNAPEARAALGVPNSGPLSGLRNLIINGNFSVNQRGYASGTITTGANQYTLDRWRVVASGQAATFTATGAGRTVTAPSDGIEQVIEGASIGGGTYVVNWTGTASCTVNGVSRVKGSTFTLTAGSNATVRFSSGTVTDVQIEPGEVVTAFELRPVGVELALCQRYYCNVDGEHRFDGVLGSSAVSFGAVWFFPVGMRSAPTLVIVAESSTNASAVTSITAKGASGAFVSWQWQDGNSVVARSKAVIVGASAEL